MAASRFYIFSAADFSGFCAQLTDWASSIESTITKLTNALTELRGQILVQIGELETLRNAFITIEVAQTRAQQFGNQMINEVTGLMQGFRDETVLIKSEHAAQNQTFKDKL